METFILIIVSFLVGLAVGIYAMYWAIKQKTDELIKEFEETL